MSKFIYNETKHCLLPLPTSAKLAKSLDMKYYFTGKQCKHNHLEVRMVVTSECTECIKHRYKRYFSKNGDAVKERVRKWKRNNRDKTNASRSNRRAKKKSLTPPDADLKIIQGFYTRAKELNDLYGAKIEIDHIHPLDAGGLHHQGNLQLLAQQLNASKGAKTDWKHPYNVDEMELTDPMLIEWVESF